MHIDDVSRSMEEWLRSTTSDVEIAFVSHFRRESSDAEPPAQRPRIEICFESIEHQKPDRGSLQRDEVFALTYRLRVAGPDALANQRVLSEIYFSAREHADFDVDAFDARGRAAASPAAEAQPATVSIVARLVRPPKAAPAEIVTQPLDVRLGSLGRIEGKVVTEAGTAIMLARIEAPALGKRVTSDAAGRFVIAGAPAAGSVSLTVTARNTSIEVTVDTEKREEVVIVVPKESEHA